MPGRRLALVAACLFLASAAAACSSSEEGPKPAQATTSPAASPSEPPDLSPSVDEPAAPPSPPEPTITELSAEEYQKRLTTAGNRMRRTLARLAETRTFQALGTRIARAEATVSGAASTLAGLHPPEEVAAPHETLVRGVRRLAAALDRVARAVEAGALCAAPSVMARLGSLRSLRPVRLATRQLRANGYDVAGLALKPRPLQTRRLATGDFVFAEVRSGFGTLAVDNGLDMDGVVVLTRGRTPVTSMYVRRNDSGLIGGIPDGTYRAFFTLGMDWDGELRTFTRNCSFARFDDTLSFDTVNVGGSIQYQTYSITLHGVVGGTASTSSISPDAFPGGG